MAGLADEGMMYKAKETVRVFAERRPSLRKLWANRSQRFEQAHAILPSTATVGESLSLTLQAWDQCERLVADFEGAFELDATDDEATYPDRVRFPARNGGVATVREISFETPGVQYLTLTHVDSGERFVANPVRVTAEPPEERLYWGDIHFHSHLSDGCGQPEDAMQFGRDVMDLDVVACTDHDTMGFFIPPRLQRRRMHRRYFQQLKDTADAFDDPGEFVALFGYEWTKQPNVGGHINVYFDDTGGAELYDSIAEASNTYEKLFERLREFNDAGGQVSDWRAVVAYTAAMLGRSLIPMGSVGSPAITAYAVDREVSLSYNETSAVVTVASLARGPGHPVSPARRRCRLAVHGRVGPVAHGAVVTGDPCLQRREDLRGDSRPE